jgi:hypothetical protein
MKQSTKRRKAASRHIPEAVGQEAFSPSELVKVGAERAKPPLTRCLSNWVAYWQSRSCT